MATINATKKTPTRREQIENVLAFLKENNYTGEVDKIESLLTPKTNETASANLALAREIATLMEAGKWYTNAEIREMPVDIPVGSRGKVEASKAAAILRIGIANGLFTKDKIGSTTIYALA